MSRVTTGLSARARLAAIAGAVAFLVLAGSGVASASWSSSTAAAGSVSAATASATVAYEGAATLDGVTYASTGSTFVARLLITDTGSSPLTYTAALATPSGTGSTLPASSVSIVLWSAATCATVPSTGWAPFTTTTLTVPGGAASGTSGVAVPLCVATQLTGAAPTSATQSLKSVLSITGKVGNWTTGAQSITFTQSAYQTPSATNLVCTTVAPVGTVLKATDGYVTLSWTTPTNAPAGAVISYKLVDASNPAGTSTTVTTPTTINYADLNGSPAYLTLFTVVNGQTSVGIPITLTRGQTQVKIFFGFFTVTANYVSCP